MPLGPRSFAQVCDLEGSGRCQVLAGVSKGAGATTRVLRTAVVGRVFIAHSVTALAALTTQALAETAPPLAAVTRIIGPYRGPIARARRQTGLPAIRLRAGWAEFHGAISVERGRSDPLASHREFASAAALDGAGLSRR